MGIPPVPGDGVTVKLQELEQLVGLLPVPSLLLGRQGVVGHQQGVGSASCTQRRKQEVRNS